MLPNYHSCSIIFYGEHYLEPFRDKPVSLEDPTSTKEIREVHTLAQEVTNQPLHLLPSLTRIYPNFINLLSNDAMGITQCKDYAILF